jgi:hypothetical protein
MNTFELSIPTRHFLQNGGNIMKSKILLSNNLNSDQFDIAKRDGNVLHFTDGSKTHIDMCWVVVNVLREKI